MMPLVVNEQAPVPAPAYHRAQARRGPALHIDALRLVMSLHLLMLCRLAHRRCPPPLPAGPGGSPRTYSDESLLLIALWRLSYPDMHDWLCDWPAAHPECFPTVKAGTGSWRSLAGGALRSERPDGHASSADQSPRSDHRQCAHPGLATR